MIHTADHRNGTSELLQPLLKLFLVFKIRSGFESNTFHKNVPDALVIKCINCDKVVRCTLENLPIEGVIINFVMLAYLR